MKLSLNSYGTKFENHFYFNLFFLIVSIRFYFRIKSDLIIPLVWDTIWMNLLFHLMRKTENKSNKVNVNKGKGIAGSDQLRK